MSRSQIEAALAAGYAAAKGASGGKNADYILFLASVSSDLLGVCVVTTHGSIFKSGDSDYAFAIESISKVFTLALVIETIGLEAVHDGVPGPPATRSHRSGGQTVVT